MTKANIKAPKNTKKANPSIEEIMGGSVGAVSTYIGVKAIRAVPMTSGEYFATRDKDLPEGLAHDMEGYAVQYPGSDNYISWSPKEPFDEAHTKVRAHSVESTLYETKQFLAPYAK